MMKMIKERKIKDEKKTEIEKERRINKEEIMIMEKKADMIKSLKTYKKEMKGEE